MKISKLFHWLYATLMFLPLVFFIPSVFYYGFNEHATNTETTTINYKYQSNEVNTLDDLILDNIYRVNFEDCTLDEIMSSNSAISLRLLKMYDYDLSNYDDFYINEYLTLTSSQNGNTDLILYFDNDFTLHLHIYLIDNDYEDPLFDIYLGELDSFDFTLIFDAQLLWITENVNYSYFSYTDYNVIESVSVNTDDTITDKLNRSWNAIFDLPMFSWTKSTFVADAFTNITGVFGLQADNPLNYLFGYFATISICWLVFDIVLYVPNLAHRWLDKGALE